MEKILSIKDAWSEFYQWVTTDSEKWAKIKTKDRHYIHKTQREFEAGIVGGHRIEKMFLNHADGRYVFHSKFWVVKNEPCPNCGGTGYDPHQNHSTTPAICQHCKTGQNGKTD